ncbi:hypothetical protein QBC45DRAFT_335893, partial [Copromyces sp. CBS 386.78]
KYIFTFIILINRIEIRYNILDLEIIKEAEDDPIIISLTIIQLIFIYILCINRVGVV